MLTATGTYRSYGTASQIIARIAGGVEQGCINVAEIMLDTAKQLAPVRTGELRDSGHVEVEKESDVVTASMIFDAPHAQFQEFGTGIHGEGTYPGELPESGVPITGSWVYDYRGLNWPGFPAHPYARPAYDQHKGEAEGIVQKAVDEAL
jgi:HK97 gp10 family phage protein